MEKGGRTEVTRVQAIVVGTLDKGAEDLARETTSRWDVLEAKLGQSGDWLKSEAQNSFRRE